MSPRFAERYAAAHEHRGRHAQKAGKLRHAWNRRLCSWCMSGCGVCLLCACWGGQLRDSFSGIAGQPTRPPPETAPNFLRVCPIAIPLKGCVNATRGSPLRLTAANRVRHGQPVSDPSLPGCGGGERTWMRADSRERYQGWFSWWIQQTITQTQEPPQRVTADRNT